MMSRYGTSVSIVLVLGILASGLGVPIRAVAESGVSETIDSTNQVVSLSDPWKVVSSSAVDGHELLVLAGGNDNVLIGTMPPSSSIDSAWMLDSAGLPLSDVTDIQVTNGWVFQYAMVDDVPYGVFALIRGAYGRDRAQVELYISPVSTFGQGMMTAQGAVRIDNRPVFRGVNGAVLQQRLESEAGRGNPVVDSARPPLSQLARESPGGTAGAVSSQKEQERSSAVGGSWTSPRYGIDVTWTGEWQATTMPERLDISQPADAENAGAPDRLVLERTDGSGVCFVLTAWPAMDEPLESWFSFWSMENATYGFPVRALDGDSPDPQVIGSVVRYIDGPRVGSVDVREARLGYGGMAHVVVDLALPMGSTEDDFRSAVAGITINGYPSFVIVRALDVSAAMPGNDPVQEARGR